MDSKKKLPDRKKLFKELQQRADEYLAGWQRSKADFENYKRSQQEWEKNVRLYAAEDLLHKIIPVIDNFELSINHIPQNEESKPWREGILHIKRQLEDVLVSCGVSVVEVKPGDSFDPNIHECVAEVCEGDSDNQKNDIILKKVVRSGYRLGDKILRPAQVTVKRGPKS